MSSKRTIEGEVVDQDGKPVDTGKGTRAGTTNPLALLEESLASVSLLQANAVEMATSLTRSVSNSIESTGRIMSLLERTNKTLTESNTSLSNTVSQLHGEVLHWREECMTLRVKLAIMSQGASDAEQKAGESDEMLDRVIKLAHTFLTMKQASKLPPVDKLCEIIEAALGMEAVERYGHCIFEWVRQRKAGER